MSLMLVGIVVVIVLCVGNIRADFTFGEPTNLGLPVNSRSADCFSCLSADGLEIYLDRADKFTQWLFGIWVAKRPTIHDDWGAPVKFGSNINTPDHDEWYASISADGLELYFTRGHPDSDYDLYVTTRETTDDEWLLAVSLGDVVNSPATEESARISADGLSLYFSSNRGGGQGDKDLYVTTRQSTNHDWSTPVNLGSTVNSSGKDSFPSISSDGLLLIFRSDRPGNYSSPWDLWMTKRRTTSDLWGEPINLGPMINTDDVDFADISPDGRTLYLTCYERPGGYNFYDIWQAPILPIVDFTADGIVALEDFSRLAQYWGQNERSVDIAPPIGNGIVDVQDLAVLAENWLRDNNP